ncbi:MAG: DJ-1/PfpI family protein [Verrucomicrobium sp.]|nr:DJ-1/PfpI family protein [Verrucomicrobium sp.]
MPSALVILAPGFEEIEGITVIDILRRAEFTVTAAGLVPGVITAARGTRHLADVDLNEVLRNDFDVVVLPGGGPGTAHLKVDDRVKAVLERQAAADRWVAALCAAPTVLLEHGFFPDAPLTCHPSEQAKVPPARLRGTQRVVVSGKLITGLAAGAALEFSYEIVRRLLGEEAVRKVNQGVCAQGHRNPVLGGGFHHTAIQVRNYDETIAFYKKLGFTEKVAWKHDARRAAMLDSGDGNYLEVFEREARLGEIPAEGGILHFALRTPDVDAAHAAALAAGATEQRAPADVTIPNEAYPVPVRISFVKAPGGEVVEFFQNELT